MEKKNVNAVDVQELTATMVINYNDTAMDYLNDIMRGCEETIEGFGYDLIDYSDYNDDNDDSDVASAYFWTDALTEVIDCDNPDECPSILIRKDGDELHISLSQYSEDQWTVDTDNYMTVVNSIKNYIDKRIAWHKANA